MTEPRTQTRRPPTPGGRSSLRRTVVQVATLAVIAAVLIWSDLFIGLLRKHADASATSPAARAGQVTSQNDGHGAQTAAPAPVTTRTS